MKIEFKNVESTINTITKQNDFKAVLLYGEDSSSVNKKFKTILNLFTQKGYEVNDLAQESLKENNTLLVEEFFSISMFATNTIYTLRLLEKENTFTKYIEDLFEKNDVSNINNFLLITANGLDTSSSLRKYAEKSKWIACIGCYEEDSRNISVLINTKLKDRGFVYNQEVVSYILNAVGNNASIIENEIEKLSLYKNNDKNLSIVDVKNCIVDIAETNLEDFCNNFCVFNKSETFRILHKIFEENIDLLVIIRMLAKYFMQLQKIKFLVDTGENIDVVFKSERIFWKQQNSMKVHLQKWSLQKINRFLEMLLNIEKTVKFSQNKNVEFENFVVKSILVFEK
ncbi:MAG: DNA polymerase III subunit delta [Rickettsiales bacterium]|nr:DNA polymerase III subunit delta [Rickettsiales bacterium]